MNLANNLGILGNGTDKTKQQTEMIEAKLSYSDVYSCKTKKKNMKQQGDAQKKQQNKISRNKARLNSDLEIFKKKIKRGLYHILKKHSHPQDADSPEPNSNLKVSRTDSTKPLDRKKETQILLDQEGPYTFEVQFRLKCHLYRESDTDETPYFKIKEREQGKPLSREPINGVDRGNRKPGKRGMSFEEFLIKYKGITLDEWKSLDMQSQSDEASLQKEFKSNTRRWKTQGEDSFNFHEFGDSDRKTRHQQRTMKAKTFSFGKLMDDAEELNKEIKKAEHKRSFESRNLIDFDLEDLDLPESPDSIISPIKHRIRSKKHKKPFNTKQLSSSLTFSYRSQTYNTAKALSDKILF